MTRKSLFFLHLCSLNQITMSDKILCVKVGWRSQWILEESIMIKEILIALGASLAILAILWVVGQIPAVISVPSDAVVAFNANACPHGWRE